jgi:hypothetical protein
MGTHHTSIFTLSREDVFDYQRCPKIVAIKAMHAMQTPVARELPHPVGSDPTAIGKANEIAIEAAFSDNAPQDALKALEAKLAGQFSSERLNDNVKAIALAALEGAMVIKEKVEKEYGAVKILGKCESRNPLMPSKILPDFVAFAGGIQRAILIESKGVVNKSSPRDVFQASYYNGIAAKFGVMVIRERLEGERRAISPIVKFDQLAETLLIYPRRQEYRKVQDYVTLDDELVRGIWEAKELGLMGKQPETNCGSACPHHRFREDMPEDTLEPAKPLPLILAKGYDESGFDMDAQYMRRLAFKILPLEIRLTLLLRKLPEKERIQLSQWLIDTLGVSPQLASNIVNWKKPEPARPAVAELLKQMASEVEPWQRILGKRFAQSTPVVDGLSTTLYCLPSESRRLISLGWDAWRK